MKFSSAGRAAPRDFPRAKPKGYPKKQFCQLEENPDLPDSFTQIYILFTIGLRIGHSKLHRRFHGGLPKIPRRFCIGLPQVTLHKVITCLSVFPFEREKYLPEFLKSVIECLTSSNIIIYNQGSDWTFNVIRD